MTDRRTTKTQAKSDQGHPQKETIKNSFLLEGYITVFSEHVRNVVINVQVNIFQGIFFDLL